MTGQVTQQPAITFTFLLDDNQIQLLPILCKSHWYSSTTKNSFNNTILSSLENLESIRQSYLSTYSFLLHLLTTIIKMTIPYLTDDKIFAR